MLVVADIKTQFTKDQRVPKQLTFLPAKAVDVVQNLEIKTFRNIFAQCKTLKLSQQ